MVFWPVQSWWHYVDIYCPHPAKEVKQVTDIYTDQREVPIDLSDIHCLGIKILARNSSEREIAFIWDQQSQKVILNLELQYFPKAPHPYQHYRHVKIEISFLIVPFENAFQGNTNLQGPEIEDFFRTRWDKFIIDHWFWPKKIAHLYNNEPIQPEFDITLPKGWEIIEDGWYYFYKVKWRNLNGEEKIEYEKEEIPSIRWNEGQVRYNYLLKFNWDYYNPQSTDHEFEFHYVSQLTWPLVILSSIIPLGFTLFSLFILFLVDLRLGIPLVFSDAALLSILVLLMSYLFTYLTFIKDGYNIPYQKWAATAFIFTLMVVFFTLICNQHSISHHFTYENLTNISSGFSKQFVEFTPLNQKFEHGTTIIQNNSNFTEFETSNYHKILIDIWNNNLSRIFL